MQNHTLTHLNKVRNMWGVHICLDVPALLCLWWGPGEEEDNYMPIAVMSGCLFVYAHASWGLRGSCNIYCIFLTYTGLMKYLVPQRTNRTHFLSLPLDLISILISSLCSEYNNATLWCIQRGMLLLNVFSLTGSFWRLALIQPSTRHRNLWQQNLQIVWSCRWNVWYVL